jgi:hypothetical protein
MVGGKTMEIYITGEVGRIVDYSEARSKPSFMRKVTLPDGANPSDYVWDGKDIVYDEFVPPQAELTEIEQLQLENIDLKKGQEMLEATVLELADFIFEGGN